MNVSTSACTTNIEKTRASRIPAWRPTFNTINSSAVLTYNTTYVSGGTWLQPLSIMTPRLIKLTAAIEF